MPTRLIRDGLLTSDRIDRLSPGAEVTYVRLLLIADDHGRHDARPAILRAKMFPLRLDRVTDADVTGWLGECEAAGLVQVYAVGGKPYLEIPKFGQRMGAKYSKWPPPPGACPAGDGQMPAVRPADDGQVTGRCQLEAHAETEAETESNSEQTPSESGAKPRRPAEKKPAKGEFAKYDPAAEQLPHPSPAFRAAWCDWAQHRREKKEALTKTTVSRQLKALADLSEANAIACIEASITKGYIGLFPENFTSAKAGRPPAHPPPVRASECQDLPPVHPARG